MVTTRNLCEPNIIEALNNNHSFRKGSSLFLLMILLVCSQVSNGQVIYQHEFGTNTISGNPYTVVPGTLDSHLSNSEWGTSYSSGFTDFTGNSGKALSIAGNDFENNTTYTLSMNVNSGYAAELSEISFWSQSSSTGPQSMDIRVNGLLVTENISIPASGTDHTVQLTGAISITGITGNLIIELTLKGATNNSGTFRLDDFTLQGNVYAAIISKQGGDWNTPATWENNRVPRTRDDVVINHAVTLDNNIIRDNGTRTTVNANHSLAVRATYTNNGQTYINGTFQLDGGGYANGSNDFIYQTGSYLVFNKPNYGIDPGQKFWPPTKGPYNVEINSGNSAVLNETSRTIEGTLTLYGGLKITNSLTVNDTLKINKGGYVDIAGHSPIYGSSTTLNYNTGNEDPYNTGTKAPGTPYYNGPEWPGTNFPHNVIVSGETILNYPNKKGPREISGDLTIDENSALYMDYNSTNCEGALTVKGNVTVSGSLSLGTQYGDDLKIGDSLFIRNPNLINYNDRAFFFIKPSGTQTITTSAGASLTIPHIVIGAGSGTGTTVQLGQNITITGSNGGDVLSFETANDVLDINGHSLTIGTTGIRKAINGNGSFAGSITSNLTLLGDGDLDTLRFVSGSGNLQNLVIDRSANNLALKLGSDLTLAGTGNNFANGMLDIAEYNLNFDENSTYTGGSNSSYILAEGNGKVIKSFSSAPASFTYPVGSSNGYSPAKITIQSATVNGSVGINVKETKHPENTLAASFIKRYWNVGTVGLGTYSADISFQYLDDDVVGTESDMVTAGYTSPKWYPGNMTDAGSNKLSVSNEYDLNRAYTGGDKFSPIAGRLDDHFRSVASDDWNKASSWEASWDGNAPWYSTTFYPTSSAKSVEIQSSHTITLTADASARLLTIDEGGTLTNTGTPGGHTLTIEDDGTPTSDFDIHGTYILLGNNPALKSGAKATVYSGGIVRVDDNAGAGKSSDFASALNILFKGNSVFDWNNTSEISGKNITYFPKTPTEEIPIFKISKPMTFTGTDTATTINGRLAVEADVELTGGSKKFFRNGINGSHTLEQVNTGDNQIFISGDNAVLGGQSLTLSLNDVMHLAASATVPVDSSVTITGKGINNNSENTFSIKGILDMTEQTITNPNGTIQINSTGTYRTKNSGFSTYELSSIPSGNVELELGSTIELYASEDQVLKARSEKDFSNIIFSGSGTKTVSSSIAPNGTITIKDTVTLDAKGHNIGGDNTNLTMLDNSRLIVGTTGTQPAMEGIYNLTGGTIEFAGSNTTEQSIRSTDGNGSIVYHHIEVSGTNVRNSDGNTILGDGGTFTVKKSGQLTINNNSIKGETDGGDYTVTLEDKSIFRCGNKKGFHGASSDENGNSSIDTNITNIVVLPGSTVEYTGGPDSTKPQIITNANDLEYSNLVLSGSSTKTAPADMLIVNGNFIKNDGGIFVHNNGTILFGGTSKQNYEAEPPYPEFFDVINNNEVDLFIKNTMEVAHQLKLGNPSILTLDGDIIIRSTDEHTARIDNIPASASINYGTGAFVVERYIAAHAKAWQLLSVPTKGSTIFNSWQNQRDDSPGRGVSIPGDYSNWEARGFDGPSNSPAMKTYDPATNTYIGIKNTGDPITNPNGYFLFVRGDRNVTYADPKSVATTLYTRGSIYEPGKAPPEITVPANRFQMVGNPYASAINFDNIQQIHVDASYYIWDPNLGGGYGYGAYRTISGDQVTPSSGNYKEDNIPPIQSGQAFFVINSGNTDGTLTFDEHAKVDSSRSIFRKGHTADIADAKLKANLFVTNSGSPILLDGVITLFKSDYALALDRRDARKLKNSGENISLNSRHSLLSIERRPMVQLTDTLFYRLEGLGKRNYQLQLKGDRLDYTGLDAFLADNYLHTLTPVQATGATPVDFTVDSDPASKDPGRFYIIFREVQGGLPVSFTNISAQIQDDDILVSWNIENSESIKSFEIESSMDGVHFSTAGTVAANSQQSYKWIDEQPAPGIHYYRIKGIEKTGKVTYSTVVNARIAAQAPVIKLYPNPVINNTLQLRFISQPAGKYIVRLTGTDGKVLLLKYLEHPGGTVTHAISINQYLANGAKQIEIQKPDGTRKVIQIIVSR